MTMTPAEANAVYDVLVRECGAPDVRHEFSDPRGEFVRDCTDKNARCEWYFHSAVGFSSKFYRGSSDGELHRVGVPAGEDTASVRAMVERANAALREMKR